MSFIPVSTNKQVPDYAMVDNFNKQNYLGNQYIYSLGNNEITSTSETALIYLNNPLVTMGSFPSNYKSLFCNLVKLICVTASETALFRVYLNPTISGAGTTETPTNLRSASSNTSIALLELSPITSANGTLILTLAAIPGLPDISNVLTILDPGKSLLITVQTSSTSTFIASQLSWYEL
jgi:hypothetical protein